ncbi:MAG: TAXI family TRAP transporter solute-binding subunit [Silicimonas sp.]|nr:TAXI family TRAP transporter solute-binding subunit [Silicimonas sp.]
MRTFSRIAGGIAITIATILGAQSAVAQTELRIGTASLGGAYYPMGQALSANVNNFADGYTMVPIVTGGGLENPRLVASGEVDVALAPASLSFLAVGGKGPYKEALNIQALGALHSSVLHIVTLPGNGIDSIADLKGRTVAVGPAGGGTLGLMRNLFKLYGMTMDDITPSFLSYADGMSQLADGNVDASFALAGFPTGAVAQIAATNELKFLELGADKMKEVVDTYSFYTSIEIPADVYGNQSPISVIGSPNLLIANGDMDPALAETLTQAIYGNMEALIAENALAAKIVPEQSLSLPIPLHPGAEAFHAK